MPVLRLTTDVAASPQACFTRSLSVDAHTASMGRSGERAVAGTTTGVLGHGDTVTWRARHFGLPFRMTVTIAEHEPHVRFVDEQLSGPFARWRHEHTFTPLPDGRTRCVDRVEYDAPLGPLGDLVERVVLTRYLGRLLETRNEWLRSALEDA